MFRVVPFALVASLSLAGCAQRPAPQSDPAQAREALGRVLDGWKRGEDLKGFQGANPALTVIERQWQSGAKLLDYELAGDGKPNGFDVQFAATLKLQDPAGKKSTEKAVYTVSTNPALVVIRAEPGG